MNELLLAIQALPAIVGVAAALTFIHASRAFTPGLLHNIVWTGGLVAGLLTVGEILDHAGEVLGQNLGVVGAGGNVLVIIGILFFALAMHRAGRLGHLFGFKDSAYFRRQPKPR